MYDDRRARHTFLIWFRQLSPSAAQTSSPWDADQPPRLHQAVPADQVIQRFLLDHPECAAHQDALQQSALINPAGTMLVDRQRWAALLER